MKLLTMVRYDLKNYINSKFYFMVMIILGVLTIIFTTYISKALFVNKTLKEPLSLVIVDLEQSMYTKFFMQKVLDSPSVQENVDVLITCEDEGYKLLQDNKVAGMVIIPSNFTRNLEDSTFEPIIVIGNYNKPLQALIIKEGIESATNLISAAQSAVFTICDYSLEENISDKEYNDIFKSSAISLSLKALGRNQIFSETTKTPWMNMNPEHYYFSSLLTLFLSLYALQGVYLCILERNNLIFSRIKSLGINLWKIIVSKWIALTIYLFIQAIIIIFICYFIKLFSFNNNIKYTLLSLIIVTSCISSFTLLISSLSKNYYIGSMSIFITSILGLFLSGGIIPYSYMPSFINVIGKFTLNHWALQSLIYSLFGSENIIIIKSLIMLILLTIVFLSLSILKLSWEDRKI